MQFAFAGSTVGAAWVLAAAPGREAATFRALMWMGGLTLGLLAAIVVLLYLRRRFRRPAPDAGGGFTLDDLRRMRKQGGITDEEYQVLRKKVLDGS